MGGAALALMPDLFLWGTLCHPPLLAAVLGRVAPVLPARLPDHEARWVAGEARPMLVPGAAGAAGVLVPGLTDADMARLAFYTGGFGAAPQPVAVETAQGGRQAVTFLPPTAGLVPGARWQIEDWASRWGAVSVATAQDVMRLYGQREPAEVRARHAQMMVRGASTLRAGGRLDAAALPELLRPHATAAREVVETARRQPYANYFAVEEYDLRFRRFDGEMSAPVTRAVFISGDAAVVLPYDPRRDRVLVIEQFRSGPYARGDAHPWLIEAVAGRIDPGETPEEAARREAREEAGLELHDLLPAAAYYPSPAAKGEFLYTFVGLADLPDDAAGLAGVAGEDEDIRAHLLPFDALLDLVEAGAADNAPLIVLAYWLARRRDRLRAGATG